MSDKNYSAQYRDGGWIILHDDRGGITPDRLAIAILFNHTHDFQTAQKHYQDFKDDFIAVARTDYFEVGGDEIDQWLKEKQNEQTNKT